MVSYPLFVENISTVTIMYGAQLNNFCLTLRLIKVVYSKEELLANFINFVYCFIHTLR